MNVDIEDVDIEDKLPVDVLSLELNDKYKDLPISVAWLLENQRHLKFKIKFWEYMFECACKRIDTLKPGWRRL